MISLWLLLKVFSSGCTAMTGVEAVSNGVMAFREPACGNAKKTLTIIIALLFVLLLGIALSALFGFSRLSKFRAGSLKRINPPASNI